MNRQKREILSKNLRYYMKLKMKSRQDITNQTGIPYASIRDYEMGYCYAKPDKIEQIAKVLDISPHNLTEESDITDVMTFVDNSRESKLMLNIVEKIAKLSTDDMDLVNNDIACLMHIIEDSEDRRLVLDIIRKLSTLSIKEKKYLLSTINLISSKD